MKEKNIVLFLFHKRIQIPNFHSQQNPEVKSPHTFRQAGETWRNMSKEDKQPYVDAANAVKRQKQREEENEKKRTVTPASKKIALVPKKEEVSLIQYQNIKTECLLITECCQ